MQPNFELTEMVAVYFLLSCYVTDNIDRALFFIQRLPVSYLKKSEGSEITRALALSRFMYTKNYKKSFELIRNSNWRESSELVRILENKLTWEAKMHIQKNYRTVSVDSMIDLFGIQDVNEITRILGFPLEDGYFKIPPRRDAKAIKEINESDIERITKLLVFLEEKPPVKTN